MGRLLEHHQRVRGGRGRLRARPQPPQRHRRLMRTCTSKGIAPSWPLSCCCFYSLVMNTRPFTHKRWTARPLPGLDLGNAVHAACVTIGSVLRPLVELRRVTFSALPPPFFDEPSTSRSQIPHYRSTCSGCT